MSRGHHRSKCFGGFAWLRWLCRAAAEAHQVPWSVSRSLSSLSWKPSTNEGVNEFFRCSGFVFSFTPASLLGSCLGSKGDLDELGGLCETSAVSSEMGWAGTRSGAVLLLHPSPTPVPNVPQFTRNKQEIKRLKKHKEKNREKKKKSPHPPTGPASTPLTSSVCVCVCMCKNQCVHDGGLQSLWEHVRTGVCLCVWRLHGGEGDS